jgi:GNAT superfamily N-acetyltransferase
MSEGYTVRLLTSDALTPACILQLADLHAQLVSNERAAPTRVDWQRIVAAHEVCVAVTPMGDIVGFVCLVAMDLPQGRRFLLEAFVVHERHRRRGVGTLLLREVRARVRALGGVELRWTGRRTRQAAMAFYEASGARVVEMEVWSIEV